MMMYDDHIWGGCFQHISIILQYSDDEVGWQPARSGETDQIWLMVIPFWPAEIPAFGLVMGELFLFSMWNPTYIPTFSNIYDD